MTTVDAMLVGSDTGVGALADHIPLYRARPAQHAPR